MKETLRYIHDMVDERPGVDASDTFTELKSFLDSLYDRVAARFVLTLDPSTEQLRDYGAPGGEPRGSLLGYTGPKVDWLVHSWLGAPHATFTNMHLTVWLGPQIKVPHLGIAFGTLPGPWCYADFVPRSDLMVDLASLDTYYEPHNEAWLDFRAREDVAPFESRALYVREALSETALCWTAQDSTSVLPFLKESVSGMVDTWLRWVDEAEPTPVEERAALAARDLAVRRNVAERDPANIMGDRLFGSELTTQLVRGLWGGDRTTERPGG